MSAAQDDDFKYNAPQFVDFLNADSFDDQVMDEFFGKYETTTCPQLVKNLFHS
jgi:hypothetical protein